MSESNDYFLHESSYADEGSEIGPGTKIWHFSHIMASARIGANCNIGQNVFIAGDVVIGNGVKIQNNVSVYAGTIIEDYVFLGPSCVLTNVVNPRSEVDRHDEYKPTILRRGATVGANATIVCGVEVGRYVFIGAGSVVTKSFSDYSLIMGNPARRTGWMSRHGCRLKSPDAEGIFTCPDSGDRYRLDGKALSLLSSKISG